MIQSGLHGVRLIALFAILFSPLFSQTSRSEQKLPVVLKDGHPVSYERAIEDLRTARVILVGETHDRLDHHLNQLEIIRRIHAIHPQTAIGVEYFQYPFQQTLDDFVAGKIDLKQMLRQTEYFDRWRFDFRLYEPILRYAQEQGLPVIALNAPAEIVGKVSAHGLNTLTAEDRTFLPTEMRPVKPAYRERLKTVFEHHPLSAHAKFDRFVEVQLVWDESMAFNAARYLDRHPDYKMIVLAGLGHIEYGFGIPERLAYRREDRIVSIIHEYDGVAKEAADYLLRSDRMELGKRGLMGVFLDPSPKPPRVSSLDKHGAAKNAGVQEGDIIVAINDEPVSNFADVRVEMWAKRPGDEVRVQVKRSAGAVSLLEFDIVLR